MLQFLLGLSTLNVNWLLASFFGGLRLYNSPPLFFIGALALLITRFYAFSVRPEILRIVAVIGAIGITSAVLHGFDEWHRRQTIAFIVAAIVWIFVYQEAWKGDIFTMDRTKAILAAYLAYFFIASAERLIHTNVLAYLVSCVFSWSCGANLDYIKVGRFSYFSVEPSASVLAIAATIMPLICANAVVNRSWKAYGLFAAGCLVLLYSRGFTAQAFVMFSLSFILFPRLSVAGVPVLMTVIIVVAASVSYVLGEQGGVSELVRLWFSGYSVTLDNGIRSGSYVTRAMNWLIGARGFMSSPIIGLGLGGTQSYFYHLYNAGYYILVTAEQSNILNGDASAYSSPMVVRIPAEIGLIGTAYLVRYGWRAFRLAFAQDHPDTMLRYAYLYSLGSMLLSFCFAPELLNPCIPAFIALLAQMLRTRSVPAASPEGAPAAPVLFAPSSVSASGSV